MICLGSGGNGGDGKIKWFCKDDWLVGIFFFLIGLLFFCFFFPLTLLVVFFCFLKYRLILVCLLGGGVLRIISRPRFHTKKIIERRPFKKGFMFIHIMFGI